MSTTKKYTGATGDGAAQTLRRWRAMVETIVRRIAGEPVDIQSQSAQPIEWNTNARASQARHRLKAVLLFVVMTILLASACRRDMQDQPKYKTYREGASRTPVEGTVARGQLREDTQLYSGKVPASGTQPANKQPFVDKLPFPVTREVLDRGQERFNINCSPCHGRLGDGEGMIVKRGFRHPPSYHIDRLRNAPVGYFFDVITNGFGAMPDYAAQITPRDRWAIAAYIRALQLSQHSAVGDLSADDLDKLKGVQ